MSAGRLRIVVDLARCEGYAQCVYAAPEVFRMHCGEGLEYDYAPDSALRLQVERAAAACPVQAITIGFFPAENGKGTTAPGGEGS